MNLLQEYLMLAIEVVSFNEYDNERSVSDYNRKATRMRKIATEIETDHPDLKQEFCELLSHENKEIRLWVAHHILEVMNCDQSCRKAALKEIRHKARTDKTTNGLGERMWLNKWYASHPKDRLI